MEAVAGTRSQARAHNLHRLMLRGGLLRFDAGPTQLDPERRRAMLCRPNFTPIAD